MANNKKSNWFLAAVPLIGIAIVLGVSPNFWPHLRGGVFLIVLALLVIEFAVIGRLINRRSSGVFIDNRNRISLSKLQAGAWTAIVLAALATAAAFNATGLGVDYRSVNGIFVVVPGELLLAMGISATSLVATPALLSLKANEAPSADAAKKASARAGMEITGNGKVAVKNSPADAIWGDIFTGEELGNIGTADIGKIQQALISLVLMSAYSGYIFQCFALSPGPILELPQLDKSFVWLLGVSHASYLAYKAAPHSTSAS